MPTRMLLVRHGQSEWNLARRWQGQAESDLTEEGREQARAGAPAIARLGLTALVSSPLRRARQTAELLTAGLDLHLELEPRFAEWDVGEWSGHTHDEIEQRWPGMLAQLHADALPATPGGESRLAFLDRLLDGLHHTALTHPGGTVLVATHAGVIRTLQRKLATSSEEPPLIANLVGRWFDVDDRGEVTLGDLVHLIGPLAETASPDL